MIRLYSTDEARNYIRLQFQINNTGCRPKLIVNFQICSSVFLPLDKCSWWPLTSSNNFCQQKWNSTNYVTILHQQNKELQVMSQKAQRHCLIWIHVQNPSKPGYSVSKLFFIEPTEEQCTTVKHGLRYLKGTTETCYKWTPVGENVTKNNCGNKPVMQTGQLSETRTSTISDMWEGLRFACLWQGFSSIYPVSSQRCRHVDNHNRILCKWEWWKNWFRVCPTDQMVIDVMTKLFLMMMMAVDDSQ